MIIVHLNLHQPLNVLLVDGDHPIALFVARCLSTVPGVRVHAMFSDSRAPLRWSRHCRSFHPYDADCDDELRLHKIKQVVDHAAIDVILPIMESDVEFTTRNLTTLSQVSQIAPVPSETNLLTGIDKRHFSELCVRHHLPVPSTVFFDGSERSKEMIQEMDFPVVMKPRRGMNGTGIREFAGVDEALAFLSASPQLNGNVIVQTFLEGNDIDCSVLCKNGKILAYTVQQGISKTENKFMPPDGIRLFQCPKVFEIVERLIDSLHWNGVAHIDMRIDSRNKQLYLIEVNGRFWGTVMGSMFAGVNFPFLACLAAQNESFAPPVCDDVRFAHVSRAIRNIKQRLFWQPTISLSWRDTPLRFALSDPIAEMVRQFQCSNES